MRLRFGRQIKILSVLSISLSSCGEKTAKNNGFTESLGETTVDDFITDEVKAADGLWTALVGALKTIDFDKSSAEALRASLGKPSIPTTLTISAELSTFNTAQTTSYVTSASSQWCQTKPAALTKANPGTKLGLSTGGFKLDSSGKPTALAANANVYLAKYKLGKDAAEPERYMFVTVPEAAPSANAGVTTDGTNYGYPVVAYAHAGASGLAYEEIAAVFGDLQANHIIFAPVFPGEPVCATYDTGTSTCTGNNILVQANTNDKPLIYENDVIDLLGSFECLKKLTTPPTGTTDKDGVFTPDGQEAISSKWALIQMTVANALNGNVTTLGGITGTACTTPSNPDYASCQKAYAGYVAASQPLAYLIGAGRGGNVANLAAARAGGINATLAADETAPGLSAEQITAITNAKAAVRGTFTGTYPGVYVPEMFSCVATLGAQSTFVAGANKLILEAWVKKSSDYFTPATLQKLDMIPGFSAIKSKLHGYIDDTALETDAKKAEAMAAYIQKIDGLLHAPLAHGSVQNWGKVFTARAASETLNTANPPAEPNGGATYEDALGSWLLLHSQKDKVANVSNTQLFTGVGLTVTLTAQKPAETDQSVPGINWLGLEVVNAEVEDNGHVFDKSFLGGKTKAVTDATTGNPVSNIDTTGYADQTPAAAIAKWLSSSGACGTAINGQADTVNNTAR
jgi:hypothetical protein